MHRWFLDRRNPSEQIYRNFYSRFAIERRNAAGIRSGGISSAGHYRVPTTEMEPRQQHWLAERYAAKLGSLDNRLINEPGVHHGHAHGGLRLLACRHHRQPEHVSALADQRHRVLDRRRAGLDE